MSDVFRFSALFQRAQRLDEELNYEGALESYLESVKCIRLDTELDPKMVPDIALALHAIARIYSARNEMDKALKFRLAEKYVYERALTSEEGKVAPLSPSIARKAGFRGSEALETKAKGRNGANSPETVGKDNGTDVQESEDKEGTSASQERSNTHDHTNEEPTAAESPDANKQMLHRAAMFDDLSGMALSSGNPSLAEDYAVKALRLRQKYGEYSDQEVMEKFGSVYAKLGFMQYQDAIRRYQAAKQRSDSMDSQTGVTAALEAVKKSNGQAHEEKGDDDDNGVDDKGENDPETSADHDEKLQTDSQTASSSSSSSPSSSRSTDSAAVEDRNGKGETAVTAQRQESSQSTPIGFLSIVIAITVALSAIVIVFLQRMY